MARVEDENDSKEKVLIVVLDASGSMRPQENDVRGGFDSFVQLHREAAEKNGWDTKLTLITLGAAPDALPKVVYSDRPISEVTPLSKEEYTTFGNTPLYDAVGLAIDTVEKEFEGSDANILYMVFTDGENNSSVKYTAEQVAEKIKEQEAKNRGFVYLGANQDAWSVGQSFGLSMKGSTKSYNVIDTADVLRDSGIASVNYMARGGGSTLNFFADENESQVKGPTLTPKSKGSKKLSVGG